MRVLNDFSTSVHRALSEIDPKYMDYPGLVICGTHTPHDMEEMIGEIRVARETGTPFLGICFGYQLAAVEWARNNGIPDATSEEWGTGTFVVKKRDRLNVGLKEGESYWNNYEVVIDFETPSNFFISQSHPEYESRLRRPHPLLVKYLTYARNMAV